MNNDWEVPESKRLEFSGKRSDICVCIPVINEGKRIQSLLEKMKRMNIMSRYDVIIADGGSTDGSLDEGYLRLMGVRALLTKTGPGKLSAQMRMAMAYGLREGYKGFIFIDGNDKDDPEGIPRFAAKLEEGYDFVQGSRYIPGGRGINTPPLRHYAIKYLHVPLISLAARRRFTDTTNGFRAYSARLLLDPGVRPFRDVFWSYELLFYLAIRASRLRMRVTEIPTTRIYPAVGKTPSKISPIRGSLNLLKILFRSVFIGYNPESGSGRRWPVLVAVAALLAGLLYAAPQFLIKNNLESGGRPFVLKQFTELGDEGYFYLQHAREVYDGHFPPKDFFLDPEIQRPSIFNAAPPAIFASFIWLAGGDINLAYIFANFFIAAILFTLFYLIGLFIFEKNKTWSLFMAFTAVFTAVALHTPRMFFSLANFLDIFVKNFYPGVNTLLPKLFLSRIDYPLTAYLVYLPAILLLFYFWKKPDWKKAAALGVFSGLLFHTYFHFWAYWSVVLGMAFLYSITFQREDKERWRGFLIAAAIAILIALPVFINQIQLSGLDVTGEISAKIGHLIERGRTFRAEMLPHYLFYVLTAALIYFFVWEKNKGQAVLFWIFLVAAVVALNAHLVTGFVPVYRHWVRAFSPIIFTILASLIYEIIQRWQTRRANIAKIASTVLIVLMALLVVKKTVNATLFIKTPVEILNSYTLPKEVVDSFNWLNDNAGPEPRIISPSFITSVQLTSLTSARPFLPFSVIAPLTNAEAEQRYLAANKIFGVPPEILENRLRGGAGIDCSGCSQPYQEKNITDDELNLYNFYFRDRGERGIPESKIKELLTRYENLKVDFGNLSAEYVYYGPLERVFTKKDFSESADLKLVYRDGPVEIYLIK